MRFRQGPLIEASIIYVFASVISFLALIAAFGLDLGSITGAFSVEAMILLLPSFVLWAIAGQLTKKKSIFVRFFIQVSINSVLAIAGLVLITNAANSLTDKSAAPNMGIVNLVFATYFLGSLAGSIFCNFWFVRRSQAAEAFEAARSKKVR